MPKVMGLDISSNTIGYAIVDYDSSKITLIKYGHIKPPPSAKGSLSFRGLKSMEKIKKLYQDENPDEVAVELYASRFSAGRSTARTIIVLSFFNELMSMVCLDTLKYEPEKYTVANIRSTISKFLKIKSVSKEQIFDLIKNTFSNFIPAKNKLGNISKESYDQADAVAVAFCHAIIKQRSLNCQK